MDSLREEIQIILDEHIPSAVTCPHCEDMFELTEVETEKMVELLLQLMLEFRERRFVGSLKENLKESHTLTEDHYTTSLGTFTGNPADFVER